jgi:general secretion pathway protein D
MNNQSAILRVVDNYVYFNITVTPATTNSLGGISTPATYTTTPHTVPVGFTMSLTPQISDANTVQINLRPTITRVIKFISDPNPVLVGGPQNLIPQTQTREMESILKIDDGQIAVLGGLMQDNINNQTDSVPILGSIPLIGSLFQYKNDTTTKTELVIFLKPTIIKNASIDDDYSTFRNTLPDDKFLTPEAQKESSAFKP